MTSQHNLSAREALDKWCSLLSRQGLEINPESLRQAKFAGPVVSRILAKNMSGESDSDLA